MLSQNRFGDVHNDDFKEPAHNVSIEQRTLFGVVIQHEKISHGLPLLQRACTSPLLAKFTRCQSSPIEFFYTI